MIPENVQQLIDKIDSGVILDSFDEILSFVKQGDFVGMNELQKRFSDDGKLSEDFISNHFQSLRSLLISEKLQSIGMYAPISLEGADLFVRFFNELSVIDPIAGRGFFAKALRKRGVEVLAGDINPYKPVTEVEQSCAKNLVEIHKDKYDLLSLCWPEMSELDYEIALQWGVSKPILFYGEIGGCTGSSTFRDHFIQLFSLDSPDDYLDHVKQSMYFGYLMPEDYTPGDFRKSIDVAVYALHTVLKRQSYTIADLYLGDKEFIKDKIQSEVMIKEALAKILTSKRWVPLKDRLEKITPQIRDEVKRIIVMFSKEPNRFNLSESESKAINKLRDVLLKLG